MMRTGRFAVVIGIVVVAVITGGVAYAQTASALVLEASGMNVPGVHPDYELPVGTIVSLPTGATLVFLHYNSCQTMTVVGGTIIFRAEAYNITGAEEVNAVRSPCPYIVTLKAGGKLEGPLIRKGAVGDLLTLSTHPTFVVAGNRAGDVVSTRISQKGQTVLEAPLSARRFRWPIKAAPLAMNTEYELTFVRSIAGAIPFTMKFKTDAIDPASEALIVIRVE